MWVIVFNFCGIVFLNFIFYIILFNVFFQFGGFFVCGWGREVFVIMVFYFYVRFNFGVFSVIYIYYKSYKVIIY